MRIIVDFCISNVPSICNRYIRKILGAFLLLVGITVLYPGVAEGQTTVQSSQKVITGSVQERRVTPL